MVADQPVEAQLLAQVTETSAGDDRGSCCAEMAAEYADDDRGFVLVKVAGGYRFQSHPDLAPYVERFVLEGQTARLSAAALETLAIVAYKQPISRAQVAVDPRRERRRRGPHARAARLHRRGRARSRAGPGRAVRHDRHCSSSGWAWLGLDDLPPVADFVPSADVVEALEEGLRDRPDETRSTVEHGPARRPSDQARPPRRLDETT